MAMTDLCARKHTHTITPTHASHIVVQFVSLCAKSWKAHRAGGKSIFASLMKFVFLVECQICFFFAERTVNWPCKAVWWNLHWIDSPSSQFDKLYGTCCDDIYFSSDIFVLRKVGVVCPIGFNSLGKIKPNMHLIELGLEVWGSTFI